ncbi:tellurite resistance TerB family protein [Agarivorans aestuarii]|uniref:Tellurite resistance TerB family protein n=1 Tax=Agarivorans aestuarii TaxID=1563703 RepID=A0ABU7G251_9ALTE|nr:tellurite resistance TerB family protein [Agarivorans aestuarii]MEE1673492.1 tellurite resistance TerB family protein [Agarivorans aestuarii]
MVNNLLNQFLGGSSSRPSTAHRGSGVLGAIPGGLAGGAAAGGIMALLVSNKSARKFAGKAATYGGAAVLGGLAYSAFSNWKKQSNSPQNRHTTQKLEQINQSSFTQAAESNEFQIKLLKAMIASAKADGHIDELEQQRIFDAVEQMQLSEQMKSTLYELMRQPISIGELASDIDTIEQKSELYLASCFAINLDNAAEQAHLDGLAYALRLPFDLAEQLQKQAHQAIHEAA